MIQYRNINVTSLSTFIESLSYRIRGRLKRAILVTWVICQAMFENGDKNVICYLLCRTRQVYSVNFTPFTMVRLTTRKLTVKKLF